MKTPDAKRWRSVAFTSKERRNYLRFPFSAEILIQTFGLRAAIQARTTNLGQLGCGVETDHPLPLGSVVKIRICTISSTFEAEAAVVHDADGKGVALQFTSVDPKDIATLRDWLKTLNEEAPFERLATRPW